MNSCSETAKCVPWTRTTRWLLWSEGLEVSWLPQPSISKGADFHFIPEQRVWKITRSPSIMLYSTHKTLKHMLCTLSKHREKPKHSDQMSKFNGRPLHSTWHPSPWSFAPSEKSRSLSSENLLDYKWRGRGNSKSIYAKQKLRLPSGTAPFLHLPELDCHYCILKPNSPAWRGEEAQITYKNKYEPISFLIWLRNASSDIPKTKCHPVCWTLPSLGHSTAQAQNLDWITFPSRVLGEGLLL